MFLKNVALVFLDGAGEVFAVLRVFHTHGDPKQVAASGLAGHGLVGARLVRGGLGGQFLVRGRLAEAKVGRHAEDGGREDKKREGHDHGRSGTGLFFLLRHSDETPRFADDSAGFADGSEGRPAPKNMATNFTLTVPKALSMR